MLYAVQSSGFCEKILHFSLAMDSGFLGTLLVISLALSRINPPVRVRVSVSSVRISLRGLFLDMAISFPF